MAVMKLHVELAAQSWFQARRDDGWANFYAFPTIWIVNSPRKWRCGFGMGCGWLFWQAWFSVKRVATLVAADPEPDKQWLRDLERMHAELQAENLRSKLN